MVRAWATAAKPGFGGIPHPTDTPEVHSPGIDPDRILVFGGGPSVGWGARSHEHALPGSLARALSARTERGVDIDVVSGPLITAQSALGAIKGLRLWRYDAIVVTLGVEDTVNLTSVHSWRRELSAVLRFLEQASSRGAHIFVAGVQPIRSIPIFDTRLGSMLDRRGRTLNDVTASMCAESPRTTFVPFTPSQRPSLGRRRTPKDYGHWAGLLADQMAAPLNAQSL